MSGRVESGSNTLRFASEGGAGSPRLPPGAGGLDDPTMDARIALSERGFEDVRASLARIEQSQAELTKDLRDFRQEVKEADVPDIRGRLQKFDGQMEKTPTLTNLIATMLVIFAAAGVFTGANLYLGRPSPPASAPTAPR